MATEEDSSWLNRSQEVAMSEGMATNGSLLDITNLQLNKIKESDVLPQHQEIIKEHLALQEKLKEATQLLKEKEKEIESKKQENNLKREQVEKDKREIEKMLKYQETTLLDIDEQICAEKTEIKTLKKECEVNHQEISEIEGKIKEVEVAMDTACEEAITQENHGYGLLLRNLDHLSGIIINYVEGKMVSVSIVGARDDHGKQIQEIEVILTFSANNFQTLLSAEVKSDVCSWQDLIDTAVQNNGDAVWLLGEIKKRFKSLHGLKDEIDSLQRKYAIDWQPEQRLLTVIIPGKRQSICKLQLHGDYPAVSSIQCLHADEQLKEKIANIKEQVKGREITTLAEWLEELHKDL